MNALETPANRLGAVILAGGRGTRLSEKCFKMLGDKHLIVHVFERVSQVAEEIVVSAKSDEQATRIRHLIPAQVVLDEIKVQTPLVGFLSGLRTVKTRYVFATACDTPFLEPDVIRLLFEQAIGREGAVPLVSEGIPQPLCAVYRRQSAIIATERSLESKRLSMLEMIAELDGVVWVSEEELLKVDRQLLTFRNINTDDDFAWAERKIKDLK